LLLCGQVIGSNEDVIENLRNCVNRKVKKTAPPPKEKSGRPVIIQISAGLEYLKAITKYDQRRIIALADCVTEWDPYAKITRFEIPYVCCRCIVFSNYCKSSSKMFIAR
jgi:hypothetical protein